MKVKLMAVFVVLVCLAGFARAGFAHSLYVKQNPTRDNGIEFGVDDAAGFVRWRAYVYCLDGSGLNTGWKDAGDGWWYYNLDRIDQRVMWRVSGLENKKFRLTYWVFKSDNTWEFGQQQEVISDTIAPFAWFENMTDGQVIEADRYFLNIKASDNLSGIRNLILTVQLPGNADMPGWTQGGLPNEYSMEFWTDSIFMLFKAPIPGNYKFSLWVKDQAHNVSSNSGGYYNVNFKFGDDPLPNDDYVPATPANLILKATDKSVTLTWQDKADNEQGYLIYRNLEYLTNVGANAQTFTDSNLQYGSQYCYKVFAFKGKLYSDPLEKCLTLNQPEPAKLAADKFVYPLDYDNIYRIEKDAEIPGGACYDYQPFGSLFAYGNKIHQGADLNLKGKNDLGEPLYAVANALVWDAGWTAGWGNYLILQITADTSQVFKLPDGTTTNQVYALYGHLNQIDSSIVKEAVADDDKYVQGEQYLKINQQVGTVGDGNGNFSPHLHFEIRINGYNQLGHGYWPVDDISFLDYFVDPLEFIENNMGDDYQAVYVHAYDQDPGKNVYVEFNQHNWKLQGRLYDGAPLAPVGWANHVYLSPPNQSNDFTWNFKLPQTGQWSVYAIMPRFYGQAQHVRYQVSYVDNLYFSEVYLNQVNQDFNQEILLGTYEFTKNKKYSVVLNSQTTDPEQNKVAADTLILVYEGQSGIGGNIDNSQKIIFTGLTQLNIQYQGIYNKPKVMCAGAGNPWPTVVMAGGQKQGVLTATQSGNVVCNIQYEDDSWFGEWYGLRPGEHLYVNGQEIKYWEDNGNNGSNAVFEIILPGDNNNDDDNQLPDVPPESGGDNQDDPPAENPVTQINVPDKVSGSGTFTAGCSMSLPADQAFSAWLNLFFMLCPALLLAGKKFFVR